MLPPSRRRDGPPRSRPFRATRRLSSTKTKKAAGIPRPHAAPIVHKHRSRTGPDAPRAHHSGEFKMVRLRVFALAIVLAPVMPASSQTLMPSSVETMRDVDPGVDDTG